MFQLTSKETNQARILIALPLILGIIWSFSSSEKVFLNEAVPAGKAIISIQSLENPDREPIDVVELGSTMPDHVFINSATIDELIACPGIGTKTAEVILLERTYGKFVDWRDLNDRVKGLSDKKIEKLQEAGVRLDSQ